MRAIWNNTIIAESNDTVVVENNHYFSQESVNPVRDFIVIDTEVSDTLINKLHPTTVTRTYISNGVKTEYLQKSGRTYHCPWKGLADYYNVVVDGKTNEDAAWVYLEPAEPAKQIKGRFAFWRGVEVTL